MIKHSYQKIRKISFFFSQHHEFNRGLNMKYIKDYTVEPNFSMQKILRW